jgi:hypothetical protein
MVRLLTPPVVEISCGLLLNIWRSVIKIITHSNNKKYLKQIREDFSASMRTMGILPAKLGGFEVIFNDLLPTEVPSKTEFVARQDKFCEYNTSKPAEWEIFCGYVKPVMVPNFIAMDDRKYTFLRNGKPEIYLWGR